MQSEEAPRAPAWDRESAKGAVHFHATPEPVADLMASLLIELAEPRTSSLDLLDPGIGEGNLSVAAHRAFSSEGIEVRIRGVDLSDDLLSKAAARLRSQRAEFSLTQTDFLRASGLGEFDAVICNPPYGKRSQAALGPRLVAEYRSAISGHPNLFALFIHKIIRLLSANGVAVIICPRSLLTGTYFAALRRFMAENVSVERLIIFDQREGLFDDVLQGVCILGLRKGIRQGACRVTRLDSRGHAENWRIDGLYTDGDRLDYRIIPGRDVNSRRLIERALTHPLRLGDRFIVETGPLVWFRAKARLATAKDDAQAVPVIWSDQIGEGFIHEGRREDRVRQVAANAFALSQSKLGPALVVKRVTAPEEPRRLVAGVTPHQLWRRPVIYENHTNVLRSRTGNAEEVLLMGAMFATDLFDQLLRMLSENTQVGAAELRLLPWPTWSFTDRQRSATLNAVATRRPLSELFFFAELEERLLEKLSSAEFRNPDVSTGRDVVNLTLPIGEPPSGAVDRRESLEL